MVKKILIFFTFLLIAFLGYFSYKLLKEKEVSLSMLIDAVPLDASLIIEINRPQLLFDLIHQPPVHAATFFEIPFIHDPLEKIHEIDSLTHHDEVARNALLRPHNAIISGHLIGKNDLEFIYYLKLEEDKEYLALNKIIIHEIQGKGNISVHNYDDAHINDISIFNQPSGNFSYAYYQGILMISKSSLLLEEVIRQTKSKISIRSNPGLETVLKASGKSSPLNIYLNFEHFESIASNLIHSRFKPELEAISKFANWVELDCNLNHNAIVLNGFSSTENNTGFLSDIFEGQEPINLTLPGLLPASTKSFFAIGIQSYEKFKTNFIDYQRKNNSHPDFEENILRFNKNRGIDLTKEFADVFDQEISFAYGSGNPDSLTSNIFTVIRTKGASEAKDFLISMGGELSTFLDSKNIYTLPVNLPSLLFGDIFSLNSNRLCFISDNYLIFGDAVPNLSQFAGDFGSQKNLSLDPAYANLTDLLSGDAYCYFYLSPQANQLYEHFLKYSSDQMLSQYKYSLSQVQAMVYQFGKNDNLLYNNAFILFNATRENGITKNWELNLDAQPVTSPCLVKNSANNQQEIMIQDEQNNLYLISTSGTILWKRKLNERILSHFFQADLFQNKKLQFVFNTKNFLMVLDKNGKDVEGFPLKLKSPATAGMACFDYDRNRNYRFLIPQNDHFIHCYDKKGKEMEGWKKPELKLLIGDIQWMAADGKDYIFFNDGDKEVFLDRKGKERIKTARTLRPGLNSNVFGSGNGRDFHFVCTDSTGTIQMISQKGAITSLKTGIYPPNHYYLHEHIDYNHYQDHLFFYDKKFEAYNASGARIVNFTLNGDVCLKPQLIFLRDSSYIFAYTDTLQNKIFLQSNRGAGINGSPLDGNSQICVEVLQNNSQLLNLYLASKNILYGYSVK